MAPITTSCMIDPFTPVGYTVNGTPVWPAQGGRGGGAIDFIVDDSDSDDDPFDDDDYEDDDDQDDDQDDGEDEDDRPRQRQRKPRQQQRRDDDGDGDEDDDWEPPTRETVAKMEEAIKRNNGELMKRRLAAKTLKRLKIDEDGDLDSWLIERGIDPETGGKLAGYDADGDDDSQDYLLDDGGDGPKGAKTRQQIIRDLKTAETRGAAKTESRYKPAVAQYAATAALREAGWRGEKTDLGLRLLDLDKLDMDFQDGELLIFGLDDQIEQIKKDLPERFGPQRRTATADEDERPARRGPARTARGGAVRVDGGDRAKPAPKRRGWLDTLDDRMTGKR